MAERGIKKIKEVDMLEWIYHVILENPLEEWVTGGPKDILFGGGRRHVLGERHYHY